MFTINLYKQLIKQNEKYLTKEEEIFLNFVNSTLKGQEEQDIKILNEAGFKPLLRVANNVQDKNNRTLKYKQKYKEVLFTKSQIKSLCLKYNLKFLPTEKYKGYIPPELGLKIREFSEKYETPIKNFEYVPTFYICAPKSSFKLEAKPVDPLLFYDVDIDDDLYALVYKWGNDLNIFNRIVGYFKCNVLVILFSLFVINVLLAIFSKSTNFFVITAMVFLVWFFRKLYTEFSESGYKIKWNSIYRD